MGYSGSDWDFVIVGGGSAGCVLANRLSANPEHRVLLLDAGGSASHLFSRLPAAIALAVESKKLNWHYQSEPDTTRNNRVDMWPAGKLLGGSSAINGMMYVRGNNWDYDHWASLGNSGWAYNDVLPYFMRLEHNERGADDFRGVGGPLWVSEERVRHPLTHAFVAAMEELGVQRNPDLNGASQEGVDYCQVSQKNGWRHSTAQAYLNPVQKRPNLRVESHAVAECIQIINGRATAVDFSQNNKSHTAKAAGGIVVAAGALASPKLLMLSGIGDPAGLEKVGVKTSHALPGVGRNLQEHPGVVLTAHVNQPTLTSDTNPIRALKHGVNYLTRGRGPLSNPVGHAHAFIRTRSELSVPNIQIIFSPLSFEHNEKGAKAYRRPAINLAVGLCRVGSRGEIRLRSSRSSDAPIIDYPLLSDPNDVAQLMEGIREARRVYRSKAFGEYFIDEYKPGEEFKSDQQLEPKVRSESFLMYHACGTCKMGNDTLAVVDSGLAVKGLDGLWVADASIIPTIPAGNINATAIMIGEKAADLIQRKVNNA